MDVEGLGKLIMAVAIIWVVLFYTHPDRLKDKSKQEDDK